MRQKRFQCKRIGSKTRRRRLTTAPPTAAAKHHFRHPNRRERESSRFSPSRFYFHLLKGSNFCQLESDYCMDENQCAGNEGGAIENSNVNDLVVSDEGHFDREPYVGMEFESEEAAKVFYDAYAAHMGFIMRVDAFRRSMRDGNVVWRRLVCNKEGFRKCRPQRSENRKPRAITRKGCKAMIVVKKEKMGKWVVTKFFKEHNHPLVIAPVNARRSAQLSQTPDEKDVKIRELTAELQRERRRSAALQEQLNSIIKDMEEHSKHLSRNITNIVQSVNEIESRRTVFPSS